jgi:hypothetical protein
VAFFIAESGIFLFVSIAVTKSIWLWLPEWEAQIIANSSSLTVNPALSMAEACKDLTADLG